MSYGLAVHLLIPNSRNITADKVNVGQINFDFMLILTFITVFNNHVYSY